MQRPELLAIALAAALSLPAMGQDFFQPLQDAIEQLTPRQERRAGPVEDAPVEAPRPRPRPEAADEDELVGEEEPELPRERPEPEDETQPGAEDDSEPAAEDATPEAARVYQTACPAVLRGLVEAEALPPLADGACGERSPISVTAVLSRGRMVKLSTPLVTNCEMASALPAWVEAVESYGLASQDTGLETIITGTSYMCRNRNNGEAGFTSEHGFANAVDIVGFTLTDGRTIGVEADWLPASSAEGRFLRFAHDAACAGFTTVLGPEANAQHKDHFHLDLGCHGQSCTARICE
jgi:hypothetical protein